MHNKMLRFLTSLGLADPERFDLDFELVGRDASNPKKVIMEYVRKNKVGKPLRQEDIDEMKKHNVPDYFIESCKKIRYLFPRAHATAYVMGAVRVAWFKIYHPLEFYATYFTVRCDKFDVEVMKMYSGDFSNFFSNPTFLYFGLIWVFVGLLGKVLGAGIGGLVCRFKLKDSLKIGVGMALVILSLPIRIFRSLRTI